MSINSKNSSEREGGNKNEEILKYVDEFIAEKSTNIEFFVSDNEISNSILEQNFLGFLAGKNIIQDLEKEELVELRKKFFSKKFEILGNIDGLAKLINSEYNLSIFKNNKQTKLKLGDIIELIKKDLKNVSNTKILLYLSSKNIRDSFISNLDSSILVNQKDKKDLLNEIFSSENNDINSYILKNENIKTALNNIHLLSSRTNQINLSNLQELFKWFDVEGQKLLLKYFMPILSLKDLVDLGILSDRDIEKDKEKFLEKEFGDLSKYPDQEKEDILGLIDIDSVYIDLNKVDISNIQTFKITDYILSKILDSENEERLENYKKSIDNFDDFEIFVKNSDKISKKIKSKFDNFKEGNYIKVNKKNDDGNEKVLCLYISSIGTKVRFFDSYKKGKILKNPTTEQSSLLDFDEIIDLFEKWSNSTDFDIFTSDNLDGKEDDIIDDFEKINSKEYFGKILDQINPEGKYIPLENTAFEIEDGKGGIIKTYVKKVNSDSITFNNGETFSFEEIITALKNNEFKRVKLDENLGEVFSSLAGAGKKEKLGKYIVQDGAIILDEEKNNKNPDEYEFLVLGEHAIKIKEINDNGVKFEYGDFKEGDLFKGKNSEFKAKEHGDFNFYEFKDFVLNKSEHNDGIDFKKTTEEQPINEVADKREGSGLKRWLSRASIAEIMMGAKHVVGSIESYLKTGNSLKSAQMARALGKYLPKAVQDELQYKLESEEKKSMENLMSNLKSKNSADMVSAIEKIILNKDSEQYEVEAALMTMVSKYGTLYNKNLGGKRDQFLWYQALGGKKGDAFYEKIKSECERSALEMAGDSKSQPVPFCEEFLVECFLGQQVKADTPFFPKRRNKFDKDYGGLLNKGIQEELEDGNNKTEGMVTYSKRLDYALGELEAGGYANGIGAINNVWGKAGNSMQNNAIPFILTYSGIGNNIPQKLLSKVTGPGMGWDTPYTTLMFNKQASQIKVYQDTVEEVVKSFNDPVMLKDLENAKNAKKNPLDALKKFWFKYGTELDARLTLKDGYIFGLLKNQDKVPKDENGKAKLNLDTLKEYYDFMKGIQSDSEFGLKEDFIKYDKIKYEDGTYMMLSGGKKLIKGKFNFPQGICDKLGNKLLNIFVTNIVNLRDKEEFKDIPLEFKKSVFKELYTYIHAGFMGQTSFYDKVIKTKEAYLLKDIGIDVDEYGLDKTRMYKGKSGDDFMGYTKAQEFQEYLEKTANNFFSSKVTISSLTNDTKEKIFSFIE